VGVPLRDDVVHLRRSQHSRRVQCDLRACTGVRRVHIKNYDRLEKVAGRLDRCQTRRRGGVMEGVHLEAGAFLLPLFNITGHFPRLAPQRGSPLPSATSHLLTPTTLEIHRAVMSQDQLALTLSLDAWLHILPYLDAECHIIPLMMTCKTLWNLGMPTLINIANFETAMGLGRFLTFLLVDPAVRIPMLRRLDWTLSENFTSEFEKIFGTLADVLEQARNLQDLSFGMRALEKEPRIVDALISGCPKFILYTYPFHHR
jgi:hypothetical protein